MRIEPQGNEGAKVASDARSSRERFERIGLRLAFLLPLTPWPALRLLVAQGNYSTGRHSADALAPVLGYVYLANVALHLVGLFLVLACRRGRPWPMPLWSVFALINGFAVWMYSEANGHFYN